MSKCRKCGGNGGEWGLMEISGYDWDKAERGDEMALSISTTSHQCVDAVGCAEQVIATGTNLEALREISKDAENYGDLTAQAKDILSTWARIYHNVR